MADIIHLLPDSIANQIAAGEVIQRPASAVKELLENSVDSGATQIHLNVIDAGRTLIQVTDNGCGMSETDARMSFERHATSKIKQTDDLFKIQTKGFRGEALASIAAIAQVELKSKLTGSELGTCICIEGSTIKSQEPVSTQEGTTLSIKNLFYNVPARRKFLKSNPVEMRHIIDEFERVSLAHPDLEFSLHHNKNEVFHLPAGSIRQRIVGIFGNKFNQRLVPVEESTNILEIKGFVGKPEFARKTRGEQFFFVNNRFIKSNYLNHAVVQAFNELLPHKTHPAYFLFLKIDPNRVDVNIHPTKTEVKFEDEKALYAIIRSAVRQSLGKYNIAPSLDFEQETSFNVAPIAKGQTVEAPVVKVNPDFNPFDAEPKPAPTPGSGYSKPASASPALDRINQQNWQKLYQGIEPEEEPEQQSLELDTATATVLGSELNSEAPQQVGLDTAKKPMLQLHGKYIVTQIKSGMMAIHQQRAHERILYERFVRALARNQGASQQELFPQTLEFSPSDASLIKELSTEISMLGIGIREFGPNAFIIEGLPAETGTTDARELLENILETYRQNQTNAGIGKHDNLARSMAHTLSVKAGKILQTEEMNNLIDELFACEMPYASPSGKTIVTTLTLDDLDQRFKS